MPPLAIVEVSPGRHFVVYAAPAPNSTRWAAASWAFFVEPLGDHRCRLVSRYRIACSDDLAMRISMGPALMEPIGFAMDRQMLLGVKERAERATPSLKVQPTIGPTATK
jgi:hypothetical protein